MSFLTRRNVLVGSLSLIAAPAIVRASSLMPIKALPPPRLFGVCSVGQSLYDPTPELIYWTHGEAEGSLSIGSPLFKEKLETMRYRQAFKQFQEYVRVFAAAGGNTLVS